MSNQIQTTFLPLHYKGLNKELRYLAEKELNETEYSRKKGLDDLRQFIEDEDLPGKFDDEQLLQFLRVAKFDQKNCQERLLKYCTMRGKRDFVEMFDEDEIMEVIDSNILGILPYRDSQGAAILYNIAEIWDPDVCTERSLTATHFALGQYALSFPATTVNGIRYAVNSSTNSTRRTLMDLTVYKNHTSNLLCLPLRMKGVVVVQANAFIRFGYAAIRHFLPTKVTSRMHIQKEIEISVPGFCSPSCLPSEFGGTMGPISNSHFRDDFLRFLKKMKSEDSLFYDSDN